MKRLIWVLVILFLLSSVSYVFADKEEVVLLKGTAAEVGRMWGQINRDSVLEKYNLYMAGADSFFSKEKLEGMEEELKNFSKISVDIANAIGCSYWIDELNAMADEIGVDRDLFISYNFGRYRNLAAFYAKQEENEGCTSFAITSPATKNDQIIFNKTRDTGVDPQAAYFKEITDAENIYKFFGEMGTSDVGISFFVNEKGLAGSADVAAERQPQGGTADCSPPGEKLGAYIVDPPKYDGLMNHMTLRYFAEKCKNIEEVREAHHFLVENGFVASGSGGTNYLFADADGNILRISDNCYTIFAEEVNPSLTYQGKTYPGIYFTVHRENSYGSPEDALVANYGNITVELADSEKVAKHPAKRKYSSSQSGFTVLIDPNYPETLTTIFISLPAYGYSIPILMGATETPRSLLDGTFYWLQKESYSYSEYHQAGINNKWWLSHFVPIRDQLLEGKDVTESINKNFLEMVDLVISMNK
jgi:hypothetical protein